MPSKIQSFIEKIGMTLDALKKDDLRVTTPIDGTELGTVNLHSEKDVDRAVAAAVEAQKKWVECPMPLRGRLIGIMAEVLRHHKDDLAELVTLECGKIRSEGLGEVQEMIDVCEYAVGLSRQIGGQIFSSELPGHTLQEKWYPKGVVGIISAFNFPVAVWAWNFTISTVCGNANIWKPSEKTPITAMVCQTLFQKAVTQFEAETGQSVPDNLSQVLIGEAETGAALTGHKEVALISATGSCAMGEKVRQTVCQDLSRDCLLELGGNNAVFISDNAPFQLAVESTLFGAIGTAGQRCTSTRRLYIQRRVHAAVTKVFKTAYANFDHDLIGNPLDEKTLVGPLIDQPSFEQMQAALETARQNGGIVTGGERVHIETFGPDAYYVRPALVELEGMSAIARTETFAPILYLMPYDTIEEAITLNNDVTQGLSSAIFTHDIKEAQRFIDGSDCGIATVNNGTSGAEIGGAFGGNKETGGGRESGSDSWKHYMNRCTQRINIETQGLSLAQGVEFPIKIDAAAIKAIK